MTYKHGMHTPSKLQCNCALQSSFCAPLKSQWQGLCFAIFILWVQVSGNKSNVALITQKSSNLFQFHSQTPNQDTVNNVALIPHQWLRCWSDLWALNPSISIPNFLRKDSIDSILVEIMHSTSLLLKTRLYKFTFLYLRVEKDSIM